MFAKYEYKWKVGVYMSFFINDNCKLYYETFGNQKAMPLLFLHGNGEDSSYFEYQIPVFAKTYYVIVMDMRGHGQSQFGNRGLDFTVFAKDVLALLDKLHIPKTLMLGFSDGGNTALTFALRYPNRISALMLNGANLNRKGMYKKVQGIVALEYYGYACLALFSKKYKRRKMIVNLMMEHPNITPIQLSTIQKPTLIIVGTNDMIADAHSELIAKSIKHAKLVRISGSHFIAHEEGALFNREVALFLNELQRL